MEEQFYIGVLVGYVLLFIFIIGIFLLYVCLYVQVVFFCFNKLVFIMFWLVVFSYLVYVVEQVVLFSIYMILFCIVLIVIKNFYDEQLVLFIYLVVILLVSFLFFLGYEFIFFQIFVGIVVLFSDVDMRDWIWFFYFILYIFVVYLFGYVGFLLIQEGNYQDIDLLVLFWLVISVFMILLAYLFILLLEWFFGFILLILLVELFDMNWLLFWQLVNKVLGIFQYFFQVVNLLEEVVCVIGVNYLLVKVVVLYYDIGKILQFKFFIEN